MKLLNPSRLGKLMRRPAPFKDQAILEYIDLLHNQIMDYQLVINTAISKNKDIKYIED